MLLLAQRFLLALLVGINVSNAAWRRPISQKAIEACRNPVTPRPAIFPDPTCWETLQMPAWMSNWNTTTTVCGQSQDLLTPCQCMYEEPWAACFMRLTFEGNRTANYECTNISAPQDCFEPYPGHIVPGPAEIYYGAHSIWGLVQYLSTWYTVLTSQVAMPAITAQLTNPTTSSATVNALLSTLIHTYAIDAALSSSLNTVIMTSSVDTSQYVVPTLQNAQELLGDLLKAMLESITSEWTSGDFMLLATSGMLLNVTGETPQTLTARISLQ